MGVINCNQQLEDVGRKDPMLDGRKHPAHHKVINMSLIVYPGAAVYLLRGKRQTTLPLHELCSKTWNKGAKILKICVRVAFQAAQPAVAGFWGLSLLLEHAGS